MPAAGKQDPKLADINSVWSAISLGNLDLLKRCAPPTFDWNELHSRFLVTPLHFVVSNMVNASSMPTRIVEKCHNGTDCFLEIAQWIIEQGGDPTIAASKDSEWQCGINVLERLTECAHLFTAAKNRSAVVVLSNVQIGLKTVAINDEHAVENALKDTKRLADIFATRSPNTSGVPATRIPDAVVDVWDSFFRNPDTHDLLFECADGNVGANSNYVAGISDVLKAILTPNMQEGISKRISVMDASVSAVRLFLEVCHTGTAVEEDFDAASVVSAANLAHRWNVSFCMPLFEAILLENCNEDTFDKIAQLPFLAELPKLNSCMKELSRTSAILKEQTDKNELSFAGKRLMQELSGESISNSAPPKKRRRSC